MSTERNGVMSKLTSDGAVIVALLTFLGYVLSAAWYQGYNRYFEIPWYYTPFSVVAIFFALVSIAGFLAFIFQLFHFISPFGLTREETIKERGVAAFVFFGVPTIFFLIYDAAPLLVWIGVGTIFLCFALIFFVLPIFGASANTYNEKLDISAQRERELFKDSPLLKFIEFITTFGETRSPIFLWVLAACLLAYYSGYSVALHQNEFYVVDGEEVIIQYDDSLVIARELLQGNMLGPIRMLTNDDISQVKAKIEYKKLGRLKLQAN